MSAQVAGLEMVTGDGTLLRADAEENPDVLDVARLGLGALGILTSVTLRVEPLFTLEAHEAPMRWDQAMDEFDSLEADNYHFEMYWFPHTDRLPDQAQQPHAGRRRAAVPFPRLARRRVPRQPRVRLGQPARQRPARAGSADQRPRRSGDHRAPLQRRAAQGVHLAACAWSSARWSTPCRARPALRASRRPRPHRAERLADQLSGRGARRARPTTYPSPPPTTATRSTSPSTPTHRPTTAATSTGSRRSCAGTTAARTGASCTAGPPLDLEPAYPRWQEFQAMRDRLDPDRIFTNAYLKRVLG